MIYKPSLLATLLVASTQASATTNQELALRLQGLLPEGRYSGISEDGRACDVSVSHGSRRNPAFIVHSDVAESTDREAQHGLFQLSNSSQTSIKRVASLDASEIDVVINRKETSSLGGWHPNHDETLIVRKDSRGKLEVDMRNRKLFGVDPNSPACKDLILVPAARTAAEDDSDH